MRSLKKIFWGFIPFIFSLSLAQTTHVLSLETRIKNLPFGLKENVVSAMPVVGVALSGGGARGLAQIGVLRALQQAGIPIDVITGTSMGSIVGGLYATGYNLKQIDSIAVNTNWENLLAPDRETNRKDLFVDQKVTEDRAIFTLRLKGFTPVLPNALNNGQKISNYLNLVTFQAPIHTDSSFNNLMEKYRAVCTNLVTGKPVVLNSGSLSEAMRASSSVSFYLSPITIDSLILVDGGLVENIPINVAKNIGANYIIAVNTTSELHSEKELSKPWNVADQVVSIPMKRLINAELKNANAIITPDLGTMDMTDFSAIKNTISKGYEAAERKVNLIKHQIDSAFVVNLKQKNFYIKNVLNIDSTASYETPYLMKYSTQDSVSSYEILNDLRTICSSGNFKTLKAEVKDFGTYSTVNFIGVENPIVKKIMVQGVYLLHNDSVASMFSSLIGHPYNASKILARIVDAISLYRNKGYSLAEVSKVNFNNKTGKLTFLFNEGKIDGIKIEGNKYTERSVITRELPISVGDYFNIAQIRQGLINLRSTNLFDDIFLNVKQVGKKNIIVLQLKERPVSVMRVGFRADNENNAQLGIDLVDENLLGTGTEIGMLFFGGSRNRTLVLENKSNRIFNTYLTYKIDAFYRSNDIYTYSPSVATSSSTFVVDQHGEYRQSFYGGSISVGTQVHKFGNLIFQGKYQIDQVRNLQYQDVDPYKTKIVSLSVSSTIDTQNKYPYPQKGFYFKGMYESAQKIFGGQVGYTNINFQYKSYFSFDSANTISPRFMLGFADKTLPLSEQYSLGGQSSFFGMRDYQYRGRQLFLTSLEYRYELPFNIFFSTYIKVRYDLGWVWPVQEDIRFKDLHHGIGATLSFDTPIGPADFSVGKSFEFVKDLPGNPLSFGSTYFYFSIGYYY